MHILVNNSFKSNNRAKVLENEPNLNANNFDKDFGEDDVANIIYVQNLLYK
jgi:hypothetical protein